jgi:AraC-like DNA-binding protein
MLLDRKIILVLCSDTDDTDLYCQVMTDLKNRILEQENLLTSIGMGSFYDSFDMVGKSYLDSVNALDYRMVYGKDCLITPDIYNNNTPGISDSYPSADLELLDASLASQNAEMAGTVISRINANIKLKSYSLHISKYICYDIFSIFRKYADFSDLGNGCTISQILDITSLVSYDTVDDFFSGLQDLIQTKFQPAPAPRPLSQGHIGQQLLEYTDSHCLSCDFQIKNMAEHFDITPQYMRKLFKNHTGLNISEYVSTKRLERAMELLAGTDMPLQDIVVEIGNSDISGFVRFFKQKTGLTPGQYRKANHPREEP